MNGLNKPGSDFKIRIDLMALTDITEQAQTGFIDQRVAKIILQGAPKKDIDTANVICALEKYLKDRRCEPDFKVVFGE